MKRKKLTNFSKLLLAGLALVAISVLITLLITELIPSEPAIAEPIRTVHNVQSQAYIEPEPIFYDIPLSVELQEYTQKVCRQYNVSYELVLAVMATESSFQVDAVNGKSHGLMQIHEINFANLTDKLSISDFAEPHNNILAGVYMLAQLNAKYDSLHLVLTAYNRGENGLNRMLDEGVTESSYSRKVIEYMEGLNDKNINRRKPLY